MPISLITKNKSNTKRRILLSGESGSGKTSSFKTFGIEGMVRCINCPGEKGVSALPFGDNFESVWLDYEALSADATKAESLRLSQEIHQGFLNLTREILDKGPSETQVLCIDGLLKFQEVCLDMATDGGFFKGEKYSARDVVPPANQLFLRYWNEVYFSSIPIVVATTWVRYDFEKESLSETDQKTQTKYGMKKLWPDLMGKMAHRIRGEFDISIHCGFVQPTSCTYCQRLPQQTREKKSHRIWQLNPRDEIEGIGIKGDDITKVYPDYIHPDWRILKTLMERG